MKAYILLSNQCVTGRNLAVDAVRARSSVAPRAPGLDPNALTPAQLATMTQAEQEAFAVRRSLEWGNWLPEQVKVQKLPEELFHFQPPGWVVKRVESFFAYVAGGLVYVGARTLGNTINAEIAATHAVTVASSKMVEAVRLPRARVRACVCARVPRATQNTSPPSRAPTTLPATPQQLTKRPTKLNPDADPTLGDAGGDEEVRRQRYAFVADVMELAFTWRAAGNGAGARRTAPRDLDAPKFWRPYQKQTVSEFSSGAAAFLRDRFVKTVVVCACCRVAGRRAPQGRRAGDAPLFASGVRKDADPADFVTDAFVRGFEPVAGTWELGWLLESTAALSAWCRACAPFLPENRNVCRGLADIRYLLAIAAAALSTWHFGAHALLVAGGVYVLVFLAALCVKGCCGRV